MYHVVPIIIYIIKTSLVKTPWSSVVLLQAARVGSLVQELRSCVLCNTAKIIIIITIYVLL